MLKINKILVLGMIFVAIFLISLNTVEAKAASSCSEGDTIKDTCSSNPSGMDCNITECNCVAFHCAWEKLNYQDRDGLCHCPNTCDDTKCDEYCTEQGYGAGECLFKNSVRSCNTTLTGYDVDKDCVCSHAGKYVQTGTYITPKLNYTSLTTVGLISIDMSTELVKFAKIHISGYSNSTDGTTWNNYIGAISNDSNLTLPNVVFGKYFNVSFILYSTLDPTKTPNLTSLTLVTTPRLKTVVQGPTVAKCGQIPEGMIYTCTSPFTTAYQNGPNQASGSIVNCDNLGNNLTILNTRLNSTEYRENNYNDNFAAYVNNSKCSLP